MTLPSGQLPLGVWSFNTRTMLSTLRGRSLLFDHFDRLLSVGRYSFTKRRHIWFISFCVFFHVFKHAGCWSPNCPGGKLLKGRWIRKWFGVKSFSLSGCSATLVSGLELRIDSVSTITVRKVSKESLLDPRMRRSVFWRSGSNAPRHRQNEGRMGDRISTLYWLLLKLCSFCRCPRL